MNIKYFDHAATTKIKKEVLDEMKEYLCENYGNPSSLYDLGKKSKIAIENSRKAISKLLNCNHDEIYFTGSGTESDNTAIRGYMYANKSKGKHIITSKIEHPAVLNTCKQLEKEGFRVSYINVDKEGIIDINELKSNIRYDTILITIMYANNEIGSIQPIREISRIAKINNIVFHTDAVQACGNIKIDVKNDNIDMLSLSGHKIYAPKGIGVLYVRKNIKFDKLLYGGHQEKDKRAGTENVASIVGIGKAAEIVNESINEYSEKLEKLRNKYIDLITKRVKDVKLNGSFENRLPGNANFSFKDINGNILLEKLNEKGICASSGSACSSGNIKPSHVLQAIGLNENMAKGSLRISFGEENTSEDVEYLVDSIRNIIEEMRGKT